MARIAKSYRTIFVEGQTLEASDVRRAFDDAYDLVNGGLELNNFQNLSFNQDTISIATATFTSTSLINAVRELYHPGYHTVHVAGFNMNNINLFPGRVMINGKMNYINSRIITSASDHIVLGTSLTGAAFVPFVMMLGAGSGATITQSDIYFTLATNISPSVCWSHDKQGYYPSIMSGTKRALVSFFNGVDCNFLDPPWNNFIYPFTADEMCATGFRDNITWTAITSVYKMYDHDEQAYSYIGRGTFPTAITGQICAPFSTIPDFLKFNYFNAVMDGQSRSLNLDANTVDSQNDIIVSLLVSGGAMKFDLTRTQIMSAFFNVKFSKISSYADSVYKKQGLRG